MKEEETKKDIKEQQASAEEQEQQAEREELRRIVEEQAREDELPLSAEFTLKKILGGEFLNAKLLR